MMQDYPIDESHVFYIDEATAILICLKHDLLDGSLPPALQAKVEANAIDLDDHETYMYLTHECGYDVSSAVDILQSANIDGLVWASSFTGTAETVEMADDCPGLEHNLDDDYILYLLPERESSPFHAAYANVNEMLEEFKSKLRAFLPENFDWQEHLCSIQGTYFA